MWPSFVSVAFLSTAAVAAVQEIWWDITFVEQVNPDGLAQRRVIGVNNTWPPPPIQLQTTDSLILHAKNMLDQVTTLHHHGISFNNSFWMDGTLGISECGIPPGGTLDYVIPTNTLNQSGTYWVYAEANGQRVDGLRGPLTLHPPKEVHTYDEEFTVILGDWYHDEHATLREQLLNIGNPAGVEPVPDSAVVYFAQNGTYLTPIGDTSSGSVGFNEKSSLPFQPGRTYRLRVLNTSAFASFFFWVDGHDMQVIEVDGTDVTETPATMLNLAAGQRYSVLVTARNDTSSNWAVHANMDGSMFRDISKPVNFNVTSSVTYSSSSQTTNSGPVASYTRLDETTLVPVQREAVPGATTTLEFEVTFETLDDGKNHGMFNRVTYNLPEIPAVFSELSLGSNAADQQAYGPSSFVVNDMDVVDLVIKNGDTRTHSFYLHGHRPMLVNRAQDYKSADTTLNPPLPSDLSNPLRRDTFEVPSGGSVTLRVVADNPGVWLLQPTNQWSLDAGLALQLIEAPLEAQKLNSSIPQALFDNCANLGISTSGNAAGHSSPDDLSGLPTGPFPLRLGWTPRAIGAMTGCVLAAVVGMLAVAWYSFGGGITDEEYEHEAKTHMNEKSRRRLFGLVRKS
ncbi:ferroxidase fet3 [Paramarasmius palmivorus]|uniref:Ferroxidase fet3 n=1 Tax=Paramarasmius palmivorus TaxID=297713 RepID=A0AAW0CA62_9AGAR